MAPVTEHRTGHRGARRPGLTWAAAGVAVTAVAGGAGLVTGALALGDGLSSRLPFASPVLGGIALVLFVAVPFAAVSVLAARGNEQVEPLATLAGLMLIGWIAVEVAVLGEVSVFHPLYAAIGVAFVVAEWHGPDHASGHRDRADTEPAP